MVRNKKRGKTLNLSTLRYFLQQNEEDLTGIFEDTYAWNTFEGKYRAYFQKYPVICLSFREIKEPSWERAWKRIRRLIQAELNKIIHSYDLDLVIQSKQERNWLKNALDYSADHTDLSTTLNYLIKWLSKATKTLPILDEYDTPLHT